MAGEEAGVWQPHLGPLLTITYGTYPGGAEGKKEGVLCKAGPIF